MRSTHIMVKLQIASDLHIEYTHNDAPDPLNYIIPKAEVLVLAGDIGSLYRIKQLRGFLERICKLFQVVLYVPGNHEFYAVHNYKPLSYKSLEQRLKSLGESISNLYILNRSSVRIDSTCIVGCTLWTKPECIVPHYIVRVNELNTKGYKRQHEKDLHYIKRMIKYCNQEKYNMVVITHHPPSTQTLQGAKKRKRFQSLYATDLEEMLIKENMKTWICGHTHKNFDFITKGGCRVVSNQKGKSKDPSIHDYSKQFTVLV